LRDAVTQPCEDFVRAHQFRAVGCVLQGRHLPVVSR
jgi:hypothetical protein